MDSGKKLYSVRRCRRTVGVVFLAAIIAFIDLTAMVASVEADSISNGLTSEGNQLWQQDSYVLDGDPEGHLFVPTGGKAGSYRKRGDEFGAGLATGDFNGDGLDDLAIAAPDEDAPTHNTDEGTAYADLYEGDGAVTIIYGNQAANGLSTTANDDQMWTVDNIGVPELGKRGQFGFALEAGDYNGDGVDDLAIGAPYAGTGGAVVILYGSSIIGLDSEHSRLYNQDTGGMHGASEHGDRFGWSLASGKFNNDHYADLAIGVPGEDDDAGAVAVIYGSQNGLEPFAGPVNQLLEQGKDGMADKAEDEIIEQESEDKGDNFGHSLAAGNFTPGYTEDLAIGVPGEIIGATGMNGAVHMVYSDNSGLNPNHVIHSNFLWHQDIVATFNGDERHVEGIGEGGDEFGFSLAAGNFGHDIVEDLAIGIPGEDSDSGAVAILFGGMYGINLYPYNDQIFDQGTDGIQGNPEGNTLRGGDRFGAELEAGNFNASKYDDLAIGVPGEDDFSGAVAVIYGDYSGLSATAGPGNQLWWQGNNGIIGAAESSDNFGSALAAGDFNGDGADGLAVGAPIEDNHKGAVNVIYAAPVLDQTPPVVTYQVSGNLGDDGWYKDNVLIDWTVVETESPDTLIKSGCSDFYSYDDTDGTTFTCEATSEGGTTVISVVVKKDSNAPSISANLETTDGERYYGHNWTNQNVNATFTCEDTLSGMRTCPEPIVLNDEGEDIIIGPVIAVDNAGNNFQISYIGTQIDKTVPVTTATVTGDVYGDESDPNYYEASKPVIVTLEVSADGYSPLQGTEYRVNNGEWKWYNSPLVFKEGGDYKVGFRTIDHAGNVETEKTETFQIWYDQEFPTITASLSSPANEHGWHNDDVTVSFTCDDNIGVASCPDPVTITDNVKNHKVEGIAIDAQDNRTNTAVYVNIDKNAPSSSEFIYGIIDQNQDGWHWQGYSFEEGYKKSEPVRLYFGATDYKPDQVITKESFVDYIEYRINDGEWQIYNGIFPVADGEYSVDHRSVDLAGNVEVFKTFEFKTDLTPPTLTSTISPAPNEFGWNNEEVSVSFVCEDALSGLNETFFYPATMSQEGEGQLANMTCEDKAFNRGEITTTVNIDLTAPMISVTATTEDGLAYVSGDMADQPVTVQFRCYDALSDIELCAESQILGEGMNQSVTGTAVDKAGNTSTITFDDIDIDFTPPEAGVQLSADSLSIAEGGTSGSYTVVLNKQPLADVTVTLAVHSQYENDIVLSPESSQLVFTPDDWDVPQTVTVTAVDDSLVEVDESINISHVITSEDLFYNGILTQNVFVSVADNDIETVPDEEEENDGNNSEVTDSLPKIEEIVPNEQATITSPDGQLNITLPAGTIAGSGTISVQSVNDSEVIEPRAGRIRIGNQIYDIQIVDSDGNAIHQLNEPIELTFQYDLEDMPEVMNEEDLRVFYWDEEFKEWFTVSSKIDPESNSLIATVDHLTIFTIMAAPDLDIAEDIRGHWAEADVLKLYSLELIKGYGDGTFQPDRAISRAEFIVLLARIYGLDPVVNPKLDFVDDVPHWAAGYVAAAIQEGWVNGYLDGTLRADELITREQMAVMAIRTIGVNEQGNAQDIFEFSDKENISNWAMSEVATAVRLGLIVGYNDGSLRAQTVTSRAETATILLRLLRYQMN